MCERVFLELEADRAADASADESEAISYGGDYGSAWKNTPDAIAWAESL
jgi:hypothetical protein